MIIEQPTLYFFQEAIQQIELLLSREAHQLEYAELISTPSDILPQFLCQPSTVCPNPYAYK